MGMKLIIEQDGIESAIEAYVREMIPGLAEGTVIDMDLAATRGPAGFTAEVRLLSQQEADEPQPLKVGTAQVASSDTTASESVIVDHSVESAAVDPEPAAPKTRKVRVSGTKPLNLSQGAKANVDATMAVVEAREAEQGPTDAPVETAVTEETEAETVADTAPVEEPVETETEAVDETAPVAEEDAPADPKPEAAETQVEAPARKSLFANLKKD